MMIEEDHMILISVERQLNQGLLIKLHDLKHMTSSQISLVRKSNGQMTRVMNSNSL
jgi:hypothetical protein